jgi:hypothetical protein
MDNPIEIKTLDDVIKYRPIKLSVNQAAKIMGITPKFLQMGLQQEKFPFGVGVRFEQWEHYINTERFIKYMKGA